MDVDAAQGRQRKNLLRQDLPEGDDDDEIRRESAQDVDEIRRFDAHRLIDRDAMFLGEYLDGRRQKLLPTPLVSVWLRHDGNDIGNLHKTRETRHGEIGSSHENHTKALHDFCSSSLRRLCATSMKSTPSR